ncbi:hypothetical protein BIT28_07760 [Photobacterium proteolyticum]|uniref:Uncharacterized protein n=1 Tax=Photobacterium proteolyticum TaxID=1903952 RepID=A0A1Q9H105_9GAMM|nr:hypothetical protein BIT28_07760 [Photobacterium proteolyticum]
MTGLSPDVGDLLDQSLVTHLTAIELPSYFDLASAPYVSEMEATFKAIHNRANSSRITRICDIITRGLLGKDKIPVLSLTFVVGEKPTVEKKSNGIIKLSYYASNTLIVDGVLSLFAIMTLLGFEHPFEKKRKLSKQSIVDNSEIRQLLSKLPIQLTLLFNSTSGINRCDMISYYSIYNQKNEQLHAPLPGTLVTEDPIKQYVKEITNAINLDEYGGMVSSVRLAKSDLAITTESTMIRVILGAIAGASAQDKNRISDFNSGKAPFTDEAKANAKNLVILFFSEWLYRMKKQFDNDRDGLHYSPSVWLALSLVIHEIIYTGGSKNDVMTAAQKLSCLDYSNKAAHWAESGVMELDVTGSYYINAAGGGRRFRKGLAKYFIKLVREHEQSI